MAPSAVGKEFFGDGGADGDHENHEFVVSLGEEFGEDALHFGIE